MPATDTCGSFGSYFKIAVEESDVTPPCLPATFDVNSERYEIISENVRYDDNIMGGKGLTGGVDKIFAHLRPGTRIVFGRILMEVGPNELNNWLPRIFGNAGSAPTFTTAERFSLRPFDIMMERDQGTVIYRHCAVNRAMFRSRASVDGDEQVLQLGLDIIGYAEEHYEDPPTNGTAVTWPSPEPALPSSTSLYWLHGDGKLTLDTNNPSAQEEYYFDAFNFMVDNNLVPQTRNFLSITCLQSRGRTFKLQCSTPYKATTHEKLYRDKFSGAGLVTFLGSKNFVSGDTAFTYDTTFTFPNLYQTRRTPATRGPGEIPYSLDLEAYRVPGTEPVSVNNTTT